MRQEQQLQKLRARQEKQHAAQTKKGDEAGQGVGQGSLGHCPFLPLYDDGHIKEVQGGPDCCVARHICCCKMVGRQGGEDCLQLQHGNQLGALHPRAG